MEIFNKLFKQLNIKFFSLETTLNNKRGLVKKSIAMLILAILGLAISSLIIVNKQTSTSLISGGLNNIPIGTYYQIGNEGIKIEGRKNLLIIQLPGTLVTYHLSAQENNNKYFSIRRALFLNLWGPRPRNREKKKYPPTKNNFV